jgi:hypothetical protein
VGLGQVGFDFSVAVIKGEKSARVKSVLCRNFMVAKLIPGEEGKEGF